MISENVRIWIALILIHGGSMAISFALWLGGEWTANQILRLMLS